MVPKYGAPWYLSHRVDVHTELKRLATEPIYGSRTAKITLSSEVVDVDREKGTLTLANGSVHQKDLIVAADGVHVSSTVLALDFNSNSVCAVSNRPQDYWRWSTCPSHREIGVSFPNTDKEAS
jgi:2-polyprenyl-6-methoxyphenol hydroxylase-like FAD-dependent oxidoreductase